MLLLLILHLFYSSLCLLNWMPQNTCVRKCNHFICIISKSDNDMLVFTSFACGSSLYAFKELYLDVIRLTFKTKFIKLPMVMMNKHTQICFFFWSRALLKWLPFYRLPFTFHYELKLITNCFLKICIIYVFVCK